MAAGARPIAEAGAGAGLGIPAQFQRPQPDAAPGRPGAAAPARAAAAAAGPVAEIGRELAPPAQPQERPVFFRASRWVQQHPLTSLMAVLFAGVGAALAYYGFAKTMEVADWAKYTIVGASGLLLGGATAGCMICMDNDTQVVPLPQQAPPQEEQRIHVRNGSLLAPAIPQADPAGGQPRGAEPAPYRPDLAEYERQRGALGGLGGTDRPAPGGLGAPRGLDVPGGLGGGLGLGAPPRAQGPWMNVPGLPPAEDDMALALAASLRDLGGAAGLPAAAGGTRIAQPADPQLDYYRDILPLALQMVEGTNVRLCGTTPGRMDLRVDSFYSPEQEFLAALNVSAAEYATRSLGRWPTDERNRCTQYVTHIQSVLGRTAVHAPIFNQPEEDGAPKRDLAMIMTLGDGQGSHYVLLYVDRQNRVLEYYDSKFDYMRNQGGKIDLAVRNIRAWLGAVDGPYQIGMIAPIQRTLQPHDTVQCGVWVLKFLEMRIAAGRTLQWDHIEPVVFEGQHLTGIDIRAERTEYARRLAAIPGDSPLKKGEAQSRRLFPLRPTIESAVPTQGQFVTVAPAQAALPAAAAPAPAKVAVAVAAAGQPAGTAAAPGREPAAAEPAAPAQPATAQGAVPAKVAVVVPGAGQPAEPQPAAAPAKVALPAAPAKVALPAAAAATDSAGGEA